MTHPIQYYSPIFRCLAQEKDLDLHVFYCLKPDREQQGIGFGIGFDWDTDLLSGYSFRWLQNIAKTLILNKKRNPL